MGHWVVFIKLGQKHTSKDVIELAVFEAFGEVLSFGLGVAKLALVRLLTVLLVNGLSFVHTVVYDANNQAHNQYTENKDLSLSSNQEHIKYGDRSNIFEWFAKGTAQNYIRNGVVKFQVNRRMFGA